MLQAPEGTATNTLPRQNKFGMPNRLFGQKTRTYQVLMMNLVEKIEEDAREEKVVFLPTQHFAKHPTGKQKKFTFLNNEPSLSHTPHRMPKKNTTMKYGM